MVGQRVTEARLAKGMKQKELLAKLQTEGIEISTPALSLLEGQYRLIGCLGGRRSKGSSTI